MAAPDGQGAPGLAPSPPTVVRQGPATWLVVLLTLGGVGVIGAVFVAGLVAGVALASRSSEPVLAPPTPGPPAATPPQLPAEPSAPPTVPAPGGAGAAGDGALDPCLVGTWEGVEHSESYETEQGPASITGLSRTLTFTPDGREVVSYDGDEATVTTEAGALPAVFDGEVRYQVTTGGGTMSFELLSAEGTITIVGPDGQERSEELRPGTGDVGYTCDETTLRQEAAGFLSVYERVS